ncbi:hypothetical protein Tco_1212895 [Tanacetum coccineum]
MRIHSSSMSFPKLWEVEGPAPGVPNTPNGSVEAVGAVENHQGRYGVSVPALHKKPRRTKIYTPYPGAIIRRITSITVNGKVAYELKGRFLDDLRNIDFSKTNGEDAVEHIENFLEIVDLVRLPKMDSVMGNLIDDPTQEPPVGKIRRFEMIKYSFGQDKEYAAIKEHEYDDFTRANDDACHVYQEIFRNIDEGWLVTREE